MIEKKKMIGEVLESLGLVTQAQIQHALREQERTGGKFGEILVKLGYISNQDICKGLATQFGIPYTRIQGIEIPPDIVRCISKELAELHGLVPLRKEGGVLVVAMSDPLNFFALDSLRAVLKCDLKGILTTDPELTEAINRYYRHPAGEAAASRAQTGPSTPLRAGTSAPSGRAGKGAGGVKSPTPSTMLKTGAAEGPGKADGSGIQFLFETEDKAMGQQEGGGDVPVIKLVGLIIEEAIKQRASDIHLEPMEERLRVRYRIDGVLREVTGPPKTLQSTVISRIKIMAKMDIAEKRLPLDGRIRVKANGRDIDLRVSTLPSNHGESVVVRILDKSSLVLGLSELGFVPKDQERFERLVSAPNGIVLVTGPTGSGKTTTLYAVLNNLNKPDHKLITVEDPVEYQMSGINQVQVKPQIGLTFASGLRSMLRQAPDCIMVGEIRDQETAGIAIQAALTGHFVLSTLHTNDAVGAVTRLVDMDIKPYLVASALQGVVAQRLVRTICAVCRTSFDPSPALLEQLGLEKTVKFFKGKGCRDCGGTGYRGRKGIFELMVVSDPLRSKILENPSSASLLPLARQEGMTTLREDGIQKALEGITTIDEVLRVTHGES